MNRDKIEGMFLGIAVGNAMGQRDEKTHLGSWMLSKVVADAIVEAGKIDMSTMAKLHLDMYKQNKDRDIYGQTTRAALARLEAGVPWSGAGRLSAVNCGMGNGVAAKVAPVGAFFCLSDLPYRVQYKSLADLTLMTHQTSMAVSSAFAQVSAIVECLTSKEFSRSHFLSTVVRNSDRGRLVRPDTVTDDDLTERLESLSDDPWLTPEMIAELYGPGDSYVYNSLPFAYAHFIQAPQSMDCLHAVTHAGGDTWTNGSIVGALLGALNGRAVFPSELVKNLEVYDEVMKTSAVFCNSFSVSA